MCTELKLGCMGHGGPGPGSLGPPPPGRAAAHKSERFKYAFCLLDFQLYICFADLRFQDAVPATIKYGEKYLAFDSIPRNAQCGDLIPFLELRLGSKVPRNARLMVNGRFLKMHETVDEVCSFQILPLD